MANEYSIIDGIIKTLISGKDGNKKVTVENFSGKDLKEFIDNQDVFWDGLIQFLQNEDVKMGKYGLKQANFLNEEDAASVVEFINDNADLIDSFLDDCLARKTEHWNESFDRLIQKYNEMVVEDKQIGETIFTIEDITKANAGNSFNGGQWVRPWENIQEYNYGEVREADKCYEALNNEEFLQFTHKAFDKFIRLLMPEYKRTVQVEDLNRNFWVIGSVIAAILEFLFKGDNPYKDVFDGILDEIAQVWENLLYLWMGFILISQKKQYEDVIFIKRNFNFAGKMNEQRKTLAFGSDVESVVQEERKTVECLSNIYDNSTIVVLTPTATNSGGIINSMSIISGYIISIYNRRIKPVTDFYTNNNNAANDNLNDAPEWKHYYNIDNLYFLMFSHYNVSTLTLFLNMEEEHSFTTPFLTFEKQHQFYATGGRARASFDYSLNIGFDSYGNISNFSINIDIHDVGRDIFGLPSKVGSLVLTLGSNKTINITANDNPLSTPLIESTIKVEQGYDSLETLVSDRHSSGGGEDV